MDFSKNWKTYLTGALNKRIIHFLDEYFTSKNIHAPEMKDIKEIDFRTIENSWLSVPSCKELMLFQQNIEA